MQLAQEIPAVECHRRARRRADGGDLSVPIACRKDVLVVKSTAKFYMLVAW
jgi:hypothetical protein